MNNSDELRLKVMEIFSSYSKCLDFAQFADDTDNENLDDDDDDVKSPCTTIATIEQQNVEHDSDNICQKTLEYERQQLKGVQFANAGSGNLKVMNSYIVTSNTCNLIWPFTPSLLIVTKSNWEFYFQFANKTSGGQNRDKSMSICR
ncbi:unnamed protein product [Rotaria magnacalcarata]|uniref:Uncharacterized protein n=1 Tax=Rotaria magnacalcarata TaxID=392030 RepID=A0A816ZNR9_9BILA|nr:unnamed protein product [Rotaria magnacalcarata]CAF1644956.1 unnamed protein product [Rotaria magnacalcarata]CAF2217229.1 unnamed protein product [Rotaria magnacalcarata]CAF3876867.1 unnamed protein product [Rotaria magnacalcarata]CAF4038271.1 unnamed protein product [Rotaria magnacalcarata]